MYAGCRPRARSWHSLLNSLQDVTKLFFLSFFFLFFNSLSKLCLYFDFLFNLVKPADNTSTHEYL